MAQATPMKSPRPLSRPQVAAITQAMLDEQIRLELSGSATALTTSEMHHMQLLFQQAARDVNEKIQAGVSS